jgi:glycerate kinase
VRIVIAPDSYKGSIGAAAAARAIAAGWRSARPDDTVTCLPLADGGEGTLDVLAAALPGTRWRRARVTGPGGSLVSASWIQLRSGAAVVELARASGLPLLPVPDPLGAHTIGVGELICRALDAGARQIAVALGGSASTDGGTGALAALGARFLNSRGRELPPGGGSLRSLAAVDLTRLRPPPRDGACCLADVNAPLLGAAGAAAVFGPQKGAAPGEVAILEDGLTRLAEVLGGDPAAPGAGAAGGTGFGLAAAWGAELLPGAEEICRIAGLAAALRGAGLVISGEGRFDATSVRGKVPGAVLAAARQAGVPAAVVAGTIAVSPPGLVVAVSLASLAGSVSAAIADPAQWLREAGRRLAVSHGPGGWP